MRLLMCLLPLCAVLGVTGPAHAAAVPAAHYYVALVDAADEPETAAALFEALGRGLRGEPDEPLDSARDKRFGRRHCFMPFSRLAMDDAAKLPRAAVYRVVVTLVDRPAADQLVVSIVMYLREGRQWRRILNAGRFDVPTATMRQQDPRVDWKKPAFQAAYVLRVVRDLSYK